MRAQEILSNLDKSVEEGSDETYPNPYEDEISKGEDLAGKQFASASSKKALTTELSDLAGSGELLDAKATPVFGPDDLRHPRSAE
ncbi:Hypothetical predicted protein [Pelobates cultripes]|uniref:Uncharacterized protein n=1 Tax=Pelobates cultripes TaxID=61616 RepID=A0AAD1WKZ0_PELCU|nr:Hypothetical predicted protein [Pelobates cultripes]